MAGTLGEGLICCLHLLTPCSHTTPNQAGVTTLRIPSVLVRQQRSIEPDDNLPQCFAEARGDFGEVTAAQSVHAAVRTTKGKKQNIRSWI